MRCVVTGCAGFIGSHLTERLLQAGHSVVGIDVFSDYYGIELKKRNMSSFTHNKDFTLIDGDIVKLDLEGSMHDAEFIFHEAAQPGVRQSWGSDFERYVHDNIMATQKILEFVKDKNIKKLVFASSSSVYGDSELPMKEQNAVRPVSPYGVSKLAAEHLCYLYWKNYNVPVVSLRYFTVYGPRQRPDMAFYKFIKAMLNGKEVVVYGDGNQTRDFTYVSDIVDANMRAMQTDALGEVFNLGGGEQVSVNEVLKVLEKVTGKPAKIRYVEKQKGDVRDTKSDISKATKILGYSPQVKLSKGLEEEVKCIKEEFDL
ncbi:MAG: NAD-dependent epimerase/dehydratase family protein [bacterium]